VSDNCSSDNTKTVVEENKKNYCHIFYSRNSDNYGIDKNFELSLKRPTSKYVWLIGDTYVLPKDGILKVLDLISSKINIYDLIITNLDGRVSDQPSGNYTDANCLLSDIGWHMTCMSCLIFKKDMLNEGDFSRYYNTDLVHVGVIFEYISRINFLIRWESEIWVSIDPQKVEVKNSWYSRVLEIWTKNWPSLIYSLPPTYDLAIKSKCIFDHSYKSRLMSAIGFLNLRSQGYINLKSYAKYSSYLPIAVRLPRIYIFFVSIFPVWPLGIIRSIYLVTRDVMRKSSHKI
jgi:glycosyltransferase involved in cell wall biosynthesis